MSGTLEKSVEKNKKKPNHMCDYGNENPTFSVANVSYAAESQ